MRNLVLAILVTIGLVGSSMAYSADDAEKRNELMIKIQKVHLLNQLLPMVLTKQQIKDILPAIEKARAEEKKVMKVWTETLEQYGTRLDDALESGVAKQDVPDPEFIQELRTLPNRFGIAEQYTIQRNVTLIEEKLDKVLNEGQKQAAMNSFNSAHKEDKSVADLPKEERYRLFIQYVFLDPLAYDLLVEMSMRRD